MGKVSITENLGLGLYKADVISQRDKIDTKIAKLVGEIATLTSKITAETDEQKQAELKLHKLSLEKKSLMLQAIETKTVYLWAADLEDNLSGTLGTAEVPDEPNGGKNIMPGGGTYTQARDGIVYPVMNMEPETYYYNAAIMPGVQRWQPRYRYGKMVVIDYGEKTCTVALNPAYSSYANLAINPCKTDSMVDYGVSLQEPSGWDGFKTNNPSHPLTNNSQSGDPLTLPDNKIQQLDDVNRAVNDGHTYEHDEYGDDWRTMAPGDTGDCEDFALTKISRLLDLGWDIKDLKLTVTRSLKEDGTSIGHAVLQIDTDKGTITLDNRFPDIMYPSDPNLNEYAWESRLTGGEWKDFASGDILEDVHIEYMDCDASAFTVGDWALVAFYGKWETPEVIGFRYEPQSCGSILINYYPEIPYEPGNNGGCFALFDGTKTKTLDVQEGVLLGPIVRCPTPTAWDDEGAITETKELIWVTAIDDDEDGPYHSDGENVFYRGFDSVTGEIVREIPIQTTITFVSEGGGSSHSR